MSYLLHFCLLGLASAVSFDLIAAPFHEKGQNEVCLSQLILEEEHVKGTYSVADGEKQVVSVDVFDNSEAENTYYTRNDVKGEGKFSFTTHASAEVIICFKNALDEGVKGVFKRRVTLWLDSGAEAADPEEFENKNEHLKPIEKKLRKLEYVADETVGDIEYLIEREAGLRSTNESANERVRNFAFLSMFVLVGVGVWQIWYLREYFKAKKLI